MNDELLDQVAHALEVAYDILSKYRLVGMDQNPRGVNDLVGSAHFAVERERQQRRARPTSSRVLLAGARPKPYSVNKADKKR